MDKQKLFQKIEEKKKKQVDKYVNTIKKIVNDDPEYYRNKKYAGKFKK